MTESDDSDDGSATGSRGKIARVIHRRSLDGLGDDLVERWTAEDATRMSLRDLAEYFNRELLAEALGEASVATLDGEAANLYRLLTDDDVTSGARVEANARLEHNGVDVDRLTADFVSRQAVHTYLTNDRGVSHAENDGDPVETERTTIQRLTSRTTTVLETKIERLRDAGRLTLGEFDVLVDVRVVCEDCGSQYEATELLERGGCGCSRTSS